MRSEILFLKNKLILLNPLLIKMTKKYGTKVKKLKAIQKDTTKVKKKNKEIIQKF